MTKQISRILEVEAKRDCDAARVMRRVQKVAFFASPHTGTDLANGGDGCESSSGHLCGDSFPPWQRSVPARTKFLASRLAKDNEIDHLILTETKKPLRIVRMIVRPDSGDRGLTLD